MNKIKTITAILFQFFLGLIIGGAVAGNKAAWISGLVLLILDLVIMYIAFATYPFKVKKLVSNPNATAYFTLSEIVSALINMSKAKKLLSPEDYSYICRVYNKFNNLTEKIIFNRDKFLCICIEMIAHFDMIAPYYIFCNNPNPLMGQHLDEGKDEYRQQAKKLIREGKFFKEEWMQLQEEFLEEFYFDF